MKHFFSNLFYGLALVLMLSSCGAREKIVYIQGAEEVGSFENTTPYMLTIRPDDKLSIIVNCKEPELAAPFNMMLQQRAFTAQSGQVTMSYGGGSPQIFWVDPEGCIQYPTIGKLPVKGMTRYQLQDYIANYLKENGYIQDPIVSVDFYSAKYSVLGDVARPGQFSFTSDRVTVLDAISLAGDLTIYGERDKVRLIRQDDGKEIVVTLDLKDPEIMKSPYFYMQQNDVLYVEPNKSKASNREVSSLYSFGLTLLSSALTIVTFIRSFK